jgi:hypothetical protein
VKSHSHIFCAVGGVLVSANADGVLPGPAIQCATRALASGDQFKGVETQLTSVRFATYRGHLVTKVERREWVVKRRWASDLTATAPAGREATRVLESAQPNNLDNRSRSGKGKHMRFTPVLLVAVLSALIGIAGADEFKPPPMKDGLWETHSTQTQQGKTVIDTSVKMCQSKELTKSLQSNGEELRKKNECTSTVTQPSPNTYVEESRCSKGPNAGSVTKIIYTYQGDTASHTEMHMSAGKSETVMTMDAKYLGSCPAGMKPGDAVMADGKKIAGGN